MLQDIKMLARPLLFLKVRNVGHETFQVAVPIAIAATIYIVTSIIKAYPGPDFFSQVQQLLFVLAPFNLAALAAVATFPSSSLDKVFSGDPKPFFRRSIRGDVREEILTRRRFLTFLFGYLTVLCFGYILLGLLHSLLIHQLNASLKPYGVYPTLKALYFISHLYLLSLIALNLLIGMYYLTDRIHRGEDSK